MKNTKDLILKVHYQKENNSLREKLRKRTNHFFGKIKNHKIITSSIVLALVLMIADMVLVMNFMSMLENF